MNSDFPQKRNTVGTTKFTNTLKLLQLFMSLTNLSNIL